MLKTFELCPKKFEFKYIKKISMPVNDEIFETGKNIHALASYYLRNENIDNMELSLSQKEREIWEYLKRIVYFSYKCVNTEYNLGVKVGEYFFSGRLDALVKNNDKYYILDYKTGTVPKNAKYDFQTMIYSLAVHKFFKTDNVSFVYIDLRNKSEVKTELTPDLVLEYENKLKTTADKIDKKDFEFSKKFCPCEYDMICYR
jgi:predicted RecB family nuclease